MDLTAASEVVSEAVAASCVIVLDGRTVHVRRAVLPYRDVLALAGYGPQASPPVAVVYPKLTGRVDVVLGPGEYAEVVPGMRLTVGRR